MVRERIKEVVDFATTESPYRDANKGWLTDDVFINWGTSKGKASNQGNEVAKVSVFWSPINHLASILFIVVFLAAIFVFTSVSFAHGRFQMPIDTVTVMPERSQLELKDPAKQELRNEVAANDTDQVVETEPEILKQSRQAEFAAAALGGSKAKK